MGEPGFLEKALRSIKAYVLTWFIVSGLLLVGEYWVLQNFFDFEPFVTALIMAGTWLVLGTISGAIVAKETSRPLDAVAKAIMHVSPSPLPVAPPDIEKQKLGKELVENLVRQVYQYASSGGSVQDASNITTGLSTTKLPVAVFGLNAEAKITYANPKAVKISNSANSVIGKDFYSMFDVLFRDQTLTDWIAEQDQNSVSAQKIWRGIRLSPFGEKTQYYDMAVSYSRTIDNTSTQAILTLIDQNEVYGAEEKGLSFIALAVHELRTPLTVLRGYIEVFEDEAKAGTLNPELNDFVRKMQAAAENLSAFVTNILNVAKIEENQLSLKLREEKWDDILNKIVADLRLRAEVHGKTIVLEIAPNLPTVGIDSVSIAEVITNLVDNAIKYSPHDKTLIKISSHVTNEGLVETIVQDFGVGIPPNVMPHLFEKFSRNYRNKANISGSGLGLYLSKALVNAHSGNIWVRSKDGVGSEFGFTLLPFAKLSEEEKNGVPREINREAHGWIKNHSLSRR